MIHMQNCFLRPLAHITRGKGFKLVGDSRIYMKEETVAKFEFFSWGPGGGIGRGAFRIL